MQTDPTCAIYAPIIAIVVSLLGKIPFIGKNPKIVAFVCSMVANGFTAFATGGALHTAQLIACVLGTFAGSVATYEVAVKPIVRAVTVPQAKNG